MPSQCHPLIQLEDHERQPCEVWTRVMGYHRPVSQFNAGKQGEHAQRRHFCESSLQPEKRRSA
ncbi:anaerobic ribonucleoside-triphosphate reductase [Marinospirillum sp.]|uniref:anaerobic ribonucleoside-triphosphate reductase n=1 Tax=Marinospirillum sp. TaxID=2183934 RepID=UPI003A84F600